MDATRSHHRMRKAAPRKMLMYQSLTNATLKMFTGKICGYVVVYRYLRIMLCHLCCELFYWLENKQFLEKTKMFHSRRMKVAIRSRPRRRFLTTMKVKRCPKEEQTNRCYFTNVMKTPLKKPTSTNLFCSTKVTKICHRKPNRQWQAIWTCHKTTTTTNTINLTRASTDTNQKRTIRMMKVSSRIAAQMNRSKFQDGA